LLAIELMLNFKLYQMNVKNTLLNKFIKEEVYGEQPPEFEDFEFP